MNAKILFFVCTVEKKCMIQSRCLLVLCIAHVFACNDNQTTQITHLDSDSLTAYLEQSIEPKDKIELVLLKAEIDTEALLHVGEYQDRKNEKSIYELYDQSLDEVEAWTDKLWGRCCTEADMRFTEFLGFNLEVSKDHSQYPFKNATDNLFATAFVMDQNTRTTLSITFDGESDMYGRLKNQTGNDLIKNTDTIQSHFEFSIVNGYAKSESAFNANARIKTVELWLNGNHMCNCRLIDTPKIQIIKGNFSFFKNDQVDIVPIEFYPGENYEDVCISAVQLSLGYSANKELDKLSKHWEF